MKIVIFGASGGTGQQIVSQALAVGHDVTAVVRGSSKLEIRHKQLDLVQADTTKDRPAIAKALRDKEAVICALGRGNSLKSDNLIATSLALIVPAAIEQGERRFILISAFGVGDSYKGAPIIMRAMYRLLLGDMYRDKKAGEDILKASDLNWTIIRPVMLSNMPGTNSYRVGERLNLSGIPKVSRADVAHFAVMQLSNKAFTGKIAEISK